jgi:hypothetical protein
MGVTFPVEMPSIQTSAPEGKEVTFNAPLWANRCSVPESTTITERTASANVLMADCNFIFDPSSYEVVRKVPVILDQGFHPPTGSGRFQVFPRMAKPLTQVKMIDFNGVISWSWGLSALKIVVFEARVRRGSMVDPLSYTS